MPYLPAFFGRIGSKRQLVPKILKLIPQHTIYVEPFIGGGSVYFAKPPSRKEYINDLDKNIIEGYRLLKDAPSEEELLKDAVKKVGNTKIKKISDETVRRIQAFINKPAKTKAQKLLKKLYLSRNTFGFRNKGFIYNPSTHYSKIRDIELYKERLKNTTILSEDYKTVIKKTDSKDTFFYLDPPYEDSDKLYEHDSINMEEMSNILRNIKGKFLMSINDSPNIRRIFKGFKIKNVLFKGSDRHKIDKNTELKWVGQADRNELFISNY